MSVIRRTIVRTRNSMEAIGRRFSGEKETMVEIQNEGYWDVIMRGRLGYTCSIRIWIGNATTADEAKQIAGWMFPELLMVDATRDDAVELPT